MGVSRGLAAKLLYFASHWRTWRGQMRAMRVGCWPRRSRLHHAGILKCKNHQVRSSRLGCNCVWVDVTADTCASTGRQMARKVSIAGLWHRPGLQIFVLASSPRHVWTFFRPLRLIGFNFMLSRLRASRWRRGDGGRPKGRVGWGGCGWGVRGLQPLHPTESRAKVGPPAPTTTNTREKTPEL